MLITCTNCIYIYTHTLCIFKFMGTIMAKLKIKKTSQEVKKKKKKGSILIGMLFGIALTFL